MKRGFKASAERLAQQLREQVGSAEDTPVPLDLVAQRLNVNVLAADDIIDRSRLEELNELQRDAFSAATFKLDSGQRVIVYNPLHEIGRTNSNIAHELAHLLLEHSVRNVESVGNFKFLTCDSEQEEEADWLGGCLLLPRPILYASARKGLGPGEIAERYKTSEPMARFRLNMSGVLVQVARQRKAQGRR